MNVNSNGGGILGPQPGQEGACAELKRHKDGNCGERSLNCSVLPPIVCHSYQFRSCSDHVPVNGQLGLQLLCFCPGLS